MAPIDVAGLWKPELNPLEVVLRATIIYAFLLVAFRVVGRKELGRWGASDVVLIFLISVAARQSIVGNDGSLTTAMLAAMSLTTAPASGPSSWSRLTCTTFA